MIRLFIGNDGHLAIWALPLVLVSLSMLVWIGYELWRSYRHDREFAARHARHRVEDGRAAEAARLHAQPNPYTTPKLLRPREPIPPSFP